MFVKYMLLNDKENELLLIKSFIYRNTLLYL